MESSILHLMKERDNMANFAVIENDVVINVIVADTLEVAEHVTDKTCVEYVDATSVAIGYTYDGSTFKPSTQTT